MKFRVRKRIPEAARNLSILPTSYNIDPVLALEAAKAHDLKSVLIIGIYRDGRTHAQCSGGPADAAYMLMRGQAEINGIVDFCLRSPTPVRSGC